MQKKLYNPEKIDLPSILLLIPHFYDKNYYQSIKKDALKKIPLLQSEVLIFKDYAIISGFLGYPSLLLVLEFIKNVKKKDIFFLGTAGSLNEKINTPGFYYVNRIYPSSIFSLFSRKDSLELDGFDYDGVGGVTGVSVDIIQRETALWLKKQKKRGIDIVEMEIFPLRVYLNKPFHAIVLITDSVTFKGVKVFSDQGSIKKEFIKAFEFIVSFLKK